MPLRRAASRERSPLDSRVCRESRGRALLLADPALAFRSHGAGLLHGWVWHRVASGLHHPHGAMKNIHAAGVADVTRALGPQRDLNGFIEGQRPGDALRRHDEILGAHAVAFPAQGPDLLREPRGVSGPRRAAILTPPPGSRSTCSWGTRS